MAEKKKKKSLGLIVPDAADPKWAGMGDTNKWQAEDDYRIMSKSGEIKSDKGRMKGVKDHHKKMMKNMEKAYK